MADSEIVTVRIDAELKRRLELLAEGRQRSKSFLAAEAIERYVAAETAFIDAVAEGIAAADAGDVVPHEDVVADARSRRARRG